MSQSMLRNVTVVLQTVSTLILNESIGNILRFFKIMILKAMISLIITSFSIKMKQVGAFF